MQEELDDNMEFWTTSPDIPPMNPLTEKAGDFRCRHLVIVAHGILV